MVLQIWIYFSFACISSDRFGFIPAGHSIPVTRVSNVLGGGSIWFYTSRSLNLSGFGICSVLKHTFPPNTMIYWVLAFWIYFFSFSQLAGHSTFPALALAACTEVSFASSPDFWPCQIFDTWSEIRLEIPWPVRSSQKWCNWKWK